MAAHGNGSSRVRKIVTVEDQSQYHSLRDILKSSGGRIIKELPLVNGFLCEFPEEKAAISAVRDVSEKVKVEDDIKFKLCYLPGFFFPPFFPYGTKPQIPPQVPKTPQAPIKTGKPVDWGLARIGAPQVWEKLKDSRVRVGIIDTGINYLHPDLSGNVRQGISTLDGHPSFMDDYGHGTHVAGIIGANGNYGALGINPYVDFYIVKAFDKKGSANLSDIIEGMDWLTRWQVDVINMSFSTNETNTTFLRAIQGIHRRGIVMVAAAGNDGGDVNYPARLPEVIAVSAIDKNDEIAGFSSSGPEINFCAPGVDIKSTWLSNGYAVKSGTSFAAPHITGTIADLINYYGPMSPYQIRELMVGGAVTLQKLNPVQQGAGLVEIPRIIR